MKGAFVRILVLAVATFQGIIAAPTRFELSVAAKSSNQTDPARTSLPSPLPAADQSAEKTFMKKNGLLPPNVKTKYGMAMNATSGPPASPKPMMLSSNFGPNSAVVKDLEFYTSLAAATYCNDVQSKKWTCKQCKVVPDGKLVLSFATAKYDTVGYVLQSVSRKAIYIAFRGTNSIESVIADIQFTLTPYPPVPGAKIHRGFLESFEESKDLLLSHASKLLTDHHDYTFYLVGHSLGGALAVLEALDLYQRDKRFTPANLKVYTYGNPTFAYYATGTGINVKRVVHERDVVPHLPPEFLGYLLFWNQHWSLFIKTGLAKAQDKDFSTARSDLLQD
ncbi:hypothetical protein Unana1_01418 [Umbelopsis nana]